MIGPRLGRCTVCRKRRLTHWRFVGIVLCRECIDDYLAAHPTAFAPASTEGEPVAPTEREHLEATVRKALAPVLWNVSNYPPRVQARMAGQSTAPLLAKCTDAVITALQHTITDSRPGG